MAVQPGLCQTWSETPKRGFLTTRPILQFYDNTHLRCYIIWCTTECFCCFLQKYSLLTHSKVCYLYMPLPLYEPRHEKTGYLHMRKQRLRSASRLPAKLISAFVFATQIVQSLYFLNPKFQASSHLLWQYSPVCVRPGRKPRRAVFSQRGPYYSFMTIPTSGAI